MVVLATTFVMFLALSTAGARMMRKDEMRARQEEAANHWQRTPELVKRNGVQNITFTNPKASDFWVNGSNLPLVDFEIGPSWAGLLPISDKPDETRQLFFWFFPPGPEGSLDDLIFWTNGGPGCSSLIGLLEENGPVTWSWGQAKATMNEYSWTNLSSIIYVEQPVGTGFSQGTPNIENEDQLAEQLVGFMQQFLQIFSELKGKKLWLTGESYAGVYLPYIANYIYGHPTLLDLSLQGIWLGDPKFSWNVIQRETPAVDFVHKYEGLFSFNHTFLEYLDRKSAACNYSDYVSTHVTYPPKGLFPLPGNSVHVTDGCDTWGEVINASLILNPAFDPYRIWDTYPMPWDVLESPAYFDRRDVKEAIHAPVDVEWSECSNVDVFLNDGDQSLPPAFTVLPNVIERNVRTVIVHGLADFELMSQGTRITIQNMTWNGMQGFQTPIVDDSFILDGVGAFGTMHSERGLTYYEVILSGHTVPQFSPTAAFQTMRYLMGFRETP